MGRTLVTGGSGQIGTVLVRALRARVGAEQVVSTYLGRKPSRADAASGPVEEVDVNDTAAMKRVVRSYGVDTIYHLAAVLSAAGERLPAATWSTNVDGLRNVLEISREEGIRRVFWPSSMAVFGGGSEKAATPQDAAMVPSTMYGITKVAGELLCNYYSAKHALDVRSIRFPGVISSEAFPGGGTTDYAVEMFYEALKKNRYTCYVREDTVLPMIYMPDCIKGMLRIMDADPSRITCHMGYNIAAMSFSAGELAKEIGKHLPGFTCDFSPDFRQAIAETWPRSLDDSLARRDWGWKPDFELAPMVTDMLTSLRATPSR